VLVGIDFVGNKSISSGELLEHIATAPTSGFFTKTARYYDADLFAIDVKRIVRWYNEKGFYEAKVTGPDEVRDEKGRVRLVVRIEEGRRAMPSTRISTSARRTSWSTSSSSVDSPRRR